MTHGRQDHKEVPKKNDCKDQREAKKNRTREDVTKDQKEVTGRRKGHKEVKKGRTSKTRRGPGKKKGSTGLQEKTRMDGNAKAEAMKTKGRETLEAPELVMLREVRQVEGDDNDPRRREEHDGPMGRQKRGKNREAKGKPAET